jgi:16S rRNA pseudouridine516 synthase
MSKLTIERLLASLGFGSRKESRALVRMGVVKIAGREVEDPFEELDARPDVIEVNGEEIPTIEKLYVMLNKPLGYECSHSPQDHESVFVLIPERFLAMGINAVGRLDSESTGLLLLSNQGDFVHRIESPRQGKDKKYVATLARSFDDKQKAQLLAGVKLNQEPGPLAAHSVNALGDREVEISIGEGRYHQVRRMFAAVGNHVEALRRVSIGGITLDSALEPGKWRFLTDAEVTGL